MHVKTRSPTQFSGLTALIANGKWAMKHEAVQEIVQLFNSYLIHGSTATEELKASFAALREERAQRLDVPTGDEQAAVALIPLHGTIFPRGSAMVEACGAIDAHTFAKRVREAADNASVASIILDVDSGGGAVTGVDVAAEAVRYAAKKKTITAVANTMMCSAAYWIASGASEIVVTAAGEVGSIGVIGTHTDESAKMTAEGLRVTYVRSAAGKALGQRGETLEGEALTAWQGEVDRLHNLFVAQVAEGRGETVAAVKRWATGEVWFGEEAVVAGLVDRVGSLAQVITEHMGHAAQSPLPAPRHPHLLAAQGNHVMSEKPQEAAMRLELKDRTGKVHTINADSEGALTDLQSIINAVETSAYNAGVDKQTQMVADALGIEPNKVEVSTLKSLQVSAEEGRAYRAHLEERVEQLAVSIYGANTPAVRMNANLAKAANIADLKVLVSDLEDRKEALYPAGRLSQAEPDKEPEATDTEEKGIDPALLD